MSLKILGGIFRGRNLFTPKTNLTRPSLGALRAAVFNICQASIEDVLFLDLFAGSGAMGLEALSRGAKKAVFIDQSSLAIECIKKNIQALGVERQTEVYQGDIFRVLAKLQETFQIICMDPPYDKAEKLIPESIHLIEEKNLLDEEGILFIEESSRKETNYETKRIILKNQRRFGTSYLSQYKKISA